MKSRKRILSMALSLFSFPLLADEPPAWPEYTVCGDYQRYCARVERIGDEDAEAWNATYRLVMMDMRTPSPKKVLWEQDYNHPGYDGGLVTREGKHFIYVEYWYRDDTPAVSIHSKDGVITINGNEFGVSSADRERTASHELWLNWDGTMAPYEVSAEFLTIRLIDGRVARVSLADGSIEFGVRAE